MKETSVIAARMMSQQLSGERARTPEDVTGRLLAVQAQDVRGARLAVRARSTGLGAVDVDDGLTERRSMVISWLNRGTLHLVRAEDYWWLHPLTTPQITVANGRRLRQEGVSEVEARRGVDAVVEALQTGGPQTRAELRRHLDSARIPTAGQALVHIRVAASLCGEIVRGPVVGAEHAFVAVADWLGDPPEPMERSDALARLALRYLAGHGPAGPSDLAKWAGLTLGDACLAFAGARVDLAERGDGLFELADRPRTARLPKPRLLGPFDPLLLGWASRRLFVGDHKLVTVNGIFRACALVGGRVVATWKLDATIRNVGPVLSVKPLEALKAGTVSALRTDAADVFRYLALRDAHEVVFES